MSSSMSSRLARKRPCSVYDASSGGPWILRMTWSMWILLILPARFGFAICPWFSVFNLNSIQFDWCFGMVCQVFNSWFWEFFLILQRDTGLKSVSPALYLQTNTTSHLTWQIDTIRTQKQIWLWDEQACLTGLLQKPKTKNQNQNPKTNLIVRRAGLSNWAAP